MLVHNLPNFWDIEPLNESKAIFSRYGVPELIISDNGPQHTSKNYKAFRQNLEFY